MKEVLDAVEVVLSDLKGCKILPFAETSRSVNNPKPPLIDGVAPLYKSVPVTSMLVVSQSALSLSAGMPVEETAELNSAIPDPVILIFETETFDNDGKLIAALSFE